MCQWGTDRLLLVPIPAELSHTGEFRWAIKGIDACIADIVQALNMGGVYTANCCCGHGKAPGQISLHDGRVLIIAQSQAEADAVLNAYIIAVPTGFDDERLWETEADPE